MTADGYSIDEIHASTVAGAHKNIIPTLGELADAPDKQLGLTMDIISKQFKILAQPPDFTTLTRDIYSAQQTFLLPAIVEILKGTASALAHLHSKGIMHGDIYAHNILVDDNGYPYLGDFGAASLYAPFPNNPRERMEVRAFGHLMDELISRNTTATEYDRQSLDVLKALRQKLLQPTTSLSFADIDYALRQAG